MAVTKNVFFHLMTSFSTFCARNFTLFYTAWWFHGQVLRDRRVNLEFYTPPVSPFKIYKGLAPNGPGFDFKDTPRFGPRALIPKFNYRAQKSASTMFENSFSVLGAKLWNTLPKCVKEAGNVDELKVLLGGHLGGIVDRPPTRGYSCVHGNSLLDFALSRGTEF